MTLHSLSHARTAGIWSTVVVALLCPVPLSATRSEQPTIPRVRANSDALIAALRRPASSAVRSSNDMIVALLLDGVRDSSTFSHLIQTIEQTDGIVYIEPGTCHRGSDKLRACLVNEIIAAGGRRYLRILVDIRKDPVELTGSIGHELKHAVEILSDRSVTTSARLLALYQNEERNPARSYETTAAIDAGSSVVAEISASRKHVVDRHH